MKSRNQKQAELDKARELLLKSEAVLLVDFSKVKTADLRNLRKELKGAANPFLVIKKRLLGLLLKEKGMELQGGDFKVPTGAVFASSLEAAAGSVYRFFAGLEKEKKIDPSVDGVKILGGFDIKTKEFVPAERIVFIGGLPPREIILGQLLYMLASPIRSFLYVLDQKSKQTT